MKLIHLSDLHIGKKVKNFSMLTDQKIILEQIIGIINDEKPDAVLISGDLYDKKVPSIEAVKVVDDLLYKLSKMDAEIFILCGNHDAPERIAYASRLIDLTGVHMSPVYDGEIKPFTLKDEYGDVNVYMLPFVKPVIVNAFYKDKNIETYTEAVRIAISSMNVDTNSRNVLLSHQFVTGASRCDSEVSVGGLDNVDSYVFDDFDYVALGHIHGPQNVVKNKVRYCGTPLQYSFSEKNHKKSVTVVNLGVKGEVEIRERELTLPHRFITIEGYFNDILTEYGDKSEKNYVEVILHDEDRIPDAFRRLQNVFEGMMQLSYDNKRTRAEKKEIDTKSFKELSELELTCQLFEAMNGAPMSKLQYEYLDKVIKEVKEELL